MTKFKQLRAGTAIAALALTQTVAMGQVVVQYGPVDAVSVPTLSQWGMIVMAMLLAMAALIAVHKNAKSKTVLSVSLGAAALLGAGLGHQVIGDAWSLPSPSMNTATGGTVSLPSNIGVIPVQNTTLVPLKIIGVTPADAQNSSTTTCDPGVIVAPGGSCDVDTGVT